MFEGSMLERVARSYHAVQEKTADEYGALLKYSAAVSQIESLEKEAEGGAVNGITFLLDSISNNSKVLMSYLLIMPNFIIQVPYTTAYFNPDLPSVHLVDRSDLQDRFQIKRVSNEIEFVCLKVLCPSCVYLVCDMFCMLLRSVCAGFVLKTIPKQPVGFD